MKQQINEELTYFEQVLCEEACQLTNHLYAIKLTSVPSKMCYVTPNNTCKCANITSKL